MAFGKHFEITFFAARERLHELIQIVSGFHVLYGDIHPKYKIKPVSKSSGSLLSANNFWLYNIFLVNILSF
jgi:hypothetical protein